MRSIWWTRRAVSLHIALVVTVPACLLLGLWQLSRATHGNSLSWAYTVEWPFFAAYAIWMWWKLVHEENALPGRRKPAEQSSWSSPGVGAGADAGQAAAVVAGDAPEPAPESSTAFDPYDESDPALAAYNRYLAGLHEDDRQRRK